MLSQVFAHFLGVEGAVYACCELALALNPENLNQATSSGNPALALAAPAFARAAAAGAA